jgi:hypothetical protein
VGKPVQVQLLSLAPLYLLFLQRLASTGSELDFATQRFSDGLQKFCNPSGYRVTLEPGLQMVAGLRRPVLDDAYSGIDMTFDFQCVLAEPEPQFGPIIVSVGDGLGVLKTEDLPGCVVKFLDCEFHSGIYAAVFQKLETLVPMLVQRCKNCNAERRYLKSTSTTSVFFTGHRGRWVVASA